MIDDSIKYTENTDYLSIGIDKAEIAICPDQILEFTFRRDASCDEKSHFEISQRELKLLLINRDKILSRWNDLEKIFLLFQD